MRIFIILVLTLALAALFALFPEVADHTLRIHAFGWVFESRQGPFLLLLVLSLALFWLLRRVLLAVLAGPGQLWLVLSTGKRKRKEAHLRDGLAEWLDMRGERGRKSFRKARGFLPGWGDALLARLPQSPADIPLPADGDDALLISLSARIGTDPGVHPRPDIGVRKAHLDAWLKVHPGAPLALERKADLLEEEGDWKGLAAMLEKIWQRGGSSAARTTPRLAAAYLHLAEGEADHATEYLRKAHRLQPESCAIVLALGRSMLAEGDNTSCRKLWLAHLDRVDDAQIAAELVSLLKGDALKLYRKLERKKATDMTPALLLLRAALAHAADLSGLAYEQMDKLLDSHPSRQAWHMQGDWHAENDNWQAAAESYRQASECGNPGPD